MMLENMFYYIEHNGTVFFAIGVILMGSLGVFFTYIH